MIKLTASAFNHIIKSCKHYTNKAGLNDLSKIIKVRQHNQRIMVTALDGAKMFQTVVPIDTNDTSTLNNDETCLLPCDIKPVNKSEPFVEIENDGNTVSITTASSTQQYRLPLKANEVHLGDIIRLLSTEPVHTVYFDPKVLSGALAGYTGSVIKVDFCSGTKGIIIHSEDSRSLVLPLHPKSATKRSFLDDSLFDNQ